jgi:hypothetical protein
MRTRQNKLAEFVMALLPVVLRAKPFLDHAPAPLCGDTVRVQKGGVNVEAERQQQRSAADAVEGSTDVRCSCGQ